MIMMRRIAFLLFFAICQTAQGGDTPPPENRPDPLSVWVNPGFLSRHFERDKGFRENNYGLGVQVGLSRINSVTGGVFRNSDDAHSRYLGWIWQPCEIGIARFGLWAGALDGYPKMRDGGLFLAALPMVSIDYKAVGVNLTVMPTYKDKLHGALIAQFKLRVWESE